MMGNCYQLQIIHWVAKLVYSVYCKKGGEFHWESNPSVVGSRLSSCLSHLPQCDSGGLWLQQRAKLGKNVPWKMVSCKVGVIFPRSVCSVWNYIIMCPIKRSKFLQLHHRMKTNRIVIAQKPWVHQVHLPKNPQHRWFSSPLLPSLLRAADPNWRSPGSVPPWRLCRRAPPRSAAPPAAEASWNVPPTRRTRCAPETYVT